MLPNIPLPHCLVPFPLLLSVFGDTLSGNSYSTIAPITQIGNNDNLEQLFPISQATHLLHGARVSKARADTRRSPIWRGKARTFSLHATRVSVTMGHGNHTEGLMARQASYRCCERPLAEPLSVQSG